MCFPCALQYKYRATAFSGVKSFSGVETGGLRVCSVVACTGDTMDTCGKRFLNYMANSTGVFEELFIFATFPTPVEKPALNADDSVVFPVVLKSSIIPLEAEAYSYDVIPLARLTAYNLTLNNYTEELFSFAVWGRAFETDGQLPDPPLSQEPNATDGASSFVLNTLLLISLICMTLVV